MNKAYFCRNFFRIDWRHKRLKNTIDLLIFYGEHFYGFLESELLKNLKTQERTRFSFWKLPKRLMSITSCKLTCYVKSVFAKFTTDLFLISKTAASLKRNSLELMFSTNSSFFFKKEGPSHQNFSLAKFMFKQTSSSYKSAGLCFVSIYLHRFMTLNFLISCKRFSTNIPNPFSNDLIQNRVIGESDQ